MQWIGSLNLFNHWNGLCPSITTVIKTAVWIYSERDKINNWFNRKSSSWYTAQTSIEQKDLSQRILAIIYRYALLSPRLPRRCLHLGGCERGWLLLHSLSSTPPALFLSLSNTNLLSKISFTQRVGLL